MREEDASHSISSELVIPVGGKSSRLRSYLDQQAIGMPKHMLTLPNQEGFLLGRIIQAAKPHFDRISISASPDNYHYICGVTEQDKQVVVEIDRYLSGPLGPLVRSLLEKQQRAFMCGGDTYCDFSWTQFKAFHQSHDLPISILIAKSAPTKKGARFIVEGGKIASWERVDSTVEEDFINIGVYILDLDARITDFLSAMTTHKEDPFFDYFIPRKLIAAYMPGTLGFNINTPENYLALCRHLGK